MERTKVKICRPLLFIVPILRIPNNSAHLLDFLVSSYQENVSDVRNMILVIAISSDSELASMSDITEPQQTENQKENIYFLIVLYITIVFATLRYLKIADLY